MELTAIVSVVAAISGVIVAWLTFGRNTNKDARSSGADSASIHADIEYIKRGIDDIKLEQRSMRNDVTKIDKRLIIVEESVKRAHSRIDELKHIEMENHNEN